MKSLDYRIPSIITDVTLFIITSQASMVQEPGRPPEKHVVDLAIKLINEEVNKELIPHLQKLSSGVWSNELMANILDDGVDSVYVIAWTMIVLSLPFHPAWHEVQAANMAKFPRHMGCLGQDCKYHCEGKVLVDGVETESEANCIAGRIVIKNSLTGKVIKPEGWTPADINGVLLEAWTRFHLKANPPHSSRTQQKD